MQLVTTELPGHPSAPSQYAIAATASLQEGRTRTLKHGDAFAVFDHNGDARSEPGSPEGLYYRDTRHLSEFYLTVERLRPMLLSSTLRDDNIALTCDLTNPDLVDASGRTRLPHDLVHIRRSRFLWMATCYERLVVRNFDERPHRLSIELSFAADFADLFEVRGANRIRRGELHAPAIECDRVILSYTGLDQYRRTTTLKFDPQPVRLSGGSAVFVMDLDARAAKVVFIEVQCATQEQPNPVDRPFLRAYCDARRALRVSSSRATAISTSNDLFNETVRRSVADLYMLLTGTPQGPYPYAGIPWFSTAFGRDGLITALETLWLDPAIARGVLCYLAANQATEVDPAADAEPGKILHEVRDGEMARLGEVPFRRYYGSVDSTPLFVMLAGAYLRRTGDLETIRELWGPIEAALTWIEAYGDRDGDGFVEYYKNADHGLDNQGWKDSHDSVSHADGTLAQGPIALVEVQAYVYGAWSAAHEIAARLGRPDLAASYLKRAKDLKEAFAHHFFDENLSTYVLALDGDKRACRVRTSNAGHALLTGIAQPEHAARTVRTLMAAHTFCGWGIRTLSALERRFNPMSYHNGSVWPHDNALIAAGFARYGFRREAAQIFEGMFAAANYIDLRRLPELFCGFPRQRARGPTFYPVACTPQAWAAGAPLFVLQSCIGLDFEPHEGKITFEEPVLPPFLDEVVLRGLKIGEGSVNVVLRRSGADVVVHAFDREGAVRVQIQS